MATLIRTSRLMKLGLRATDGEIGAIKDLYFDDQTWAVQYLVADTGGWLTGRKVLISPQSAGRPDWDAGVLGVALTRKQIEDSPPISEDEPVSRQAQTRLGAYFNWGAYWTGYLGPGLAGVPPAARSRDEEAATDARADPHLRSLKEVLGYAIQASDGEIGHVEDFVVQVDGWALRYMIVDTRDWLPGRKVLVSPAWITDLDWVRAHVAVDLPTESIRNAPPFDPSRPPQRDYEARLHEHYRKPAYWGAEPQQPRQAGRGGPQP
jgi:hypothetical protein